MLKTYLRRQQKPMNGITRFISKDIPIEKVDENTIDDYIMHLKNNSGIKDITINSYLRSIRALFEYFIEQGYIEKFTIHMLKVDKIHTKGR